MNRPGPQAGPQPMRGISGFPAPQPSQTRHNPLSSARMPNGKIGSGSGWGFGMAMGSAPSLQTSQTRNSSTAGGAGSGLGGFGQGIGSSQPATPLDLSEFPSLSGAPQQPQSQNSSHAVWGQRTTQQQQPPTQRTQQGQNQPQPSAGQTATGQQPQSSQQPSHDDIFSSSAHFSTGLDDFRHSGQSGQMPGSGQPQTGSIDEFPPLGRNISGDVGQDRRGNIMQNSAFGGYGSGLGFGGALGQGQSRNGLSSQVNGQEGSRISSQNAPGLGGVGMPTSRSPNTQGQNGIIGQDKNGILPSDRNGGSNISGFSQSNSLRDSLSDPIQAQGSISQRHQQSRFASDLVDSPGASSDQTSLQQMSELDRFGLAGLMSMITSEGPDLASLANGQDLTTLGLDLNQPEPLYQHFASPFAEAMATRPLEQDYTLPSCYTVQSVQPLQTRVPSFQDETLFYIFYSMPRDVMQEVVAAELSNRNWRYHKVERMWLTRDNTYHEPISIGQDAERGFYVFFDYNSWKKVRREFVLRYSDLDDRALGRSLGATGTSS